MCSSEADTDALKLSHILSDTWAGQDVTVAKIAVWQCGKILSIYKAKFLSWDIWLIDMWLIDTDTVTTQIIIQLSNSRCLHTDIITFQETCMHVWATDWVNKKLI